ncbi:MAG: zf-TFIIB domain-containing protein [Phycisphaerae bacterium]
MPRCPSCFILMTRVEENNIRICTCNNCFGNWMPYPTLLRLVRGNTKLQNPAPPATPAVLPDSHPEITPVVSPDPAASSTPAEPSLEDLAAIVVASNTSKSLSCPECQVPMRKDRLHPMIPISIDRCKQCDGVWLDVGKKPLLIRLWAELQASTDLKVIALRDKVAHNALAWENHRMQDEEFIDQLNHAAHRGSTAGRFLNIVSILTRT